MYPKFMAGGVKVETSVLVQYTIAAIGLLSSLAAATSVFWTLKHHVDHEFSDPDRVATLVRSAPRQWLQNVLTQK